MDASSPLEPSGAAAILARKAAEDATAVREFAANLDIADGIIGFWRQLSRSLGHDGGVQPPRPVLRCALPRADPRPTRRPG